jgi:iron complex transport system ATP-binding protein
MRLLRDIARNRKKAILIATHELDLALEVADEFWLMGAQGQFFKGVPEELIIKGNFNQVFDQQELAFDGRSGRFRFPHPQKASIRVEAPSAFSWWLSHALEKQGYCSSDHAEISLKMDPHLNWSLALSSEQLAGEGLAALLHTLTKHHG